MKILSSLLVEKVRDGRACKLHDTRFSLELIVITLEYFVHLLEQLSDYGGFLSFTHINNLLRRSKLAI